METFGFSSLKGKMVRWILLGSTYFTHTRTPRASILAIVGMGWGTVFLEKE